jgi:hypothetical protein
MIYSAKVSDILDVIHDDFINSHIFFPVLLNRNPEVWYSCLTSIYLNCFIFYFYILQSYFALGVGASFPLVLHLLNSGQYYSQTSNNIHQSYLNIIFYHYTLHNQFYSIHTLHTIIHFTGPQILRNIGDESSIPGIYIRKECNSNS